MGSEKILVVDDVREQREIATVLLTKRGYRVETVPSGEHALVYVRKPCSLERFGTAVRQVLDGKKI